MLKSNSESLQSNLLLSYFVKWERGHATEYTTPQKPSDQGMKKLWLLALNLLVAIRA